MKALSIAVFLVLGILFSILAHTGIEMAYLAWAGAKGMTVTWYGGCALHPAIQAGLVLLGALGGFIFGRRALARQNRNAAGQHGPTG